MKDTYADYFIDWYKFLQKHIAKDISEDQSEITDLSAVLQGICESNAGDKNQVIDTRQQAVLSHIEHLYDKRPAQINLKSIAIEFFEERDFFLRKLPELDTIPQSVNRFRKLATDSRWVKFKKTFKILAFQSSKAPFYLANAFRKEKKVLVYWPHQIKVQALAKRCFVNSFYALWESIEGQRVVFFLNFIKDIKSQKFQSAEEIHAAYATFKAAVYDQISKWYEEKSNVFHYEYELVDTIEFKKKSLTESHLEKNEIAAIEDWEDVYRQWSNTTHASFEDWRSQLELSALKAFVSMQKHETVDAIGAWHKQLDHDFMKKIIAFLEDCLNHFKEEKLDAAEIKKEISQLSYQTKKQLDQELLKTFEKQLSENRLLNHLDRFEHLLDTRIDQLEAEYVVVKVHEFDQPLNDGELSEISNYELLTFEISPLIQDKLEKLKNELFNKLGNLLIAVGDIDEIVNYVLSTASNALQETVEIHEVQHLLKEGYERALNATVEIESQLSDINSLAQEELEAIELSLAKEVDALSKKENIAALKLRISKAKAIRKSEDFSKKVIGQVLEYFNVAKDFTLKRYQQLVKLLQQLNKRFLSINVTDQPQRAVSDFLNESTKTIRDLPLIYRRLYAIEPLKDVVLFEGRIEEISRFKEAYAAWNDGKYGDVILTGEKWSGLTSLINYILKETKFKHAYSRLSFKDNNTDADHMLQLFAETFGLDHQSSSEELIEYLNSGSKRIVILEDLQNLYLRKIGGQEAINLLIEIIAATQKNIFWVVSISLYAYHYLNRTLKISAFFSYPIVLGNMDVDTISTLIVKRNRVSGFKINFEPSEAMAEDKKFLKLDEAAQQEFLRKKFFKELHSFSKSNVSMALTYWLLSTKAVSGHAIIIKSFEKPDFSFLNSLQSDRVFVLNALIMHDGLNIEQVAEVLNMTNRKVRFLIIEMLEDGILIMEEDYYLVNPIIYRNTVQLLKDKNLLNQ